MVKEPDGVLHVSATTECGWSIDIQSDKPIEELDPLKIRIACDNHRLGTLIKRAKDGFVFYNDYEEKFYKIKWADVIERFRKAKPVVCYTLGDMIEIELAKETKKPAKTPKGRFDEESPCYNQDPLWPVKK
jgi:hypothetical protein